MAEKQVDARGLSCPEPVLRAREALEGLASGTVEVLVDTAASRDNVTRMARKMGCSVEAGESGEDIRLTIRKGP